MIAIDLPLPPDCLHPNARPHWRAKAAATKAARNTACLLAMAATPVRGLHRARYTLAYRLPRKRDYDGLLSWAKAYLDGLTDAGVLVDDNELRPDGITRLSGAKATGGVYGVRIEIFPE